MIICGATFEENPIFYARTSYIEFDIHLYTSPVAERLDELARPNILVISTTDELADSMTIPLKKARFQVLRSKFQVISRHP